MWRGSGVRWRDGSPVWTWAHPELDGRESPLLIGDALSFTVAPDAVRLCGGVWRAGRLTACPHGAVLPPAARRDQCEACAALDRSFSVAADTRADDPQPYAVYLAYFGPGLLKVGITAVRRGPARLLEQAAVCFTFLGEGPLMTARRTEAVLGTALRVPDRIPAAAKRAARHELPAAGARADELKGLYDEVTALRGRLPESLRLRPFEAVDHGARFGLPSAPPTAEVTALPAGRTLAGTVLAVAGHDVHLMTGGTVTLLDTRLTTGWPLRRGAPGAVSDAPTAPLARPVRQPEPLF
ncbi:DUF2797 domain-containing protein [Streptomyces sp. NBC_01476]|uniref:DUF2797 domain-containing protein n=1 Tax=Streptomyces sp. NBC_01476 TaxID=2903881 RepID=UPI002E34E3F7|nr:DUF2797 domain-containing protein [Streptomyces sp. NBC_01476]